MSIKKEELISKLREHTNDIPLAFLYTNLYFKQLDPTWLLPPRDLPKVLAIEESNISPASAKNPFCPGFLSTTDLDFSTALLRALAMLPDATKDQERSVALMVGTGNVFSHLPELASHCENIIYCDIDDFICRYINEMRDLIIRLQVTETTTVETLRARLSAFIVQSDKFSMKEKLTILATLQLEFDTHKSGERTRVTVAPEYYIFNNLKRFQQCQQALMEKSLSTIRIDLLNPEQVKLLSAQLK